MLIVVPRRRIDPLGSVTPPGGGGLGLVTRPAEHRDRVDRHDRRQPAELVGRLVQLGGELVERFGGRRQHVEPPSLLLERLHEGFIEPPPGAADELDHRGLAEQRPQQLLVDERGRSGDADLRAGQAGGVDEGRQHHPDADGVDPDRGAPRESPFALARLGDVRPDRRDPFLEPSPKPVVEAGRRAPQRRVGGDRIGDRAVLRPGGCRPASCLGGMQAGHGDEVVGRGLAYLGDRGTRRPEDAGDGATDRADPPREDAGDVVRADVILPVPQRFLAQERAAADRLPDRREAAIVVRGGDPAICRGIDRLVGHVVGDLVDERAEARE